MGSQVTAICECGVIEEIMIGGGMMNFMTTCYFPCLCKRCHEVVQVNLLAKQKRCPNCRSTKVIPYDSPELIGSVGSEIRDSWNMEEKLGRELILTNGTYFCPACKQMTLHFEEGGVCWD